MSQRKCELYYIKYSDRSSTESSRWCIMCLFSNKRQLLQYEHDSSCVSLHTCVCALDVMCTVRVSGSPLVHTGVLAQSLM